MSRRYRYCGLVLESDLPLPELPEAAADADLVVRYARVPVALPDAVCREVLYEHNGREAIWRLDGIARYLIAEGGRRIDVDAAPLADAAEVRLFLLQPVFVLACLLRGDWLLNAAAVARNGEAVAFIGASGCGKSTVAAALATRGFRVVSDSLLRIARDGDRLLAHPQAPWLWLWPDTLSMLPLGGYANEKLRPAIELRRVSMPAVAGPVPVSRIALLRQQLGDDPDLFDPVSRQGMRAVDTLVRHLAGNSWLAHLGSRPGLFGWSSALAAAVTVERIEVPWGAERMPDLLEQLVRWLDGGPPMD